MPKRTRKPPRTNRRYRRRMNKAAVAMNSKISRFPKGPWRKFNSVDPFPVNYNTKFTYVSESIMSTNTVIRMTGTGIQEYRLNSIYDPDFTAVGVTPTNTAVYGFNQLLSSTGPYTRYKVNAVKVELLVYDPSADGIALCSHIKTAHDTYGIGGIDVQFLERAPMTCVNRLNDSGSQKKRLVQYIPMNQICGFNKLQFKADQDNTTGPYNNNPALTPRLVLAAVNLADATAQTIRVRTKITYYTQLYGRYAQTGKE